MEDCASHCAGNTIVIQPSSSTPLSLLEVAKIFQEVLPKGVVNILTGKGSESGNAIFNHDGVDKLSFTGSTDVGYQVAEGYDKTSSTCYIRTWW